MHSFSDKKLNGKNRKTQTYRDYERPIKFSR